MSDSTLSLTVVVPTYNRSSLLRETLSSLLRATIPPTLSVALLVVDNNSCDDTRNVVDELAATAPIPLRYLLETRQSSSFARNAGILATQSDLIGFIDDDEQISESWFAAVAREFADPTLQFIGGPYFAPPGFVPPPWLPPDYPAVIGIQQPRPRAAFGSAHTGNLNSGNCVLRRSVFNHIGLYSPELGRSGKGLLSEEDAELYSRIRALHLPGLFVPDLVIFHHVPPDRLTPRYHRRWCFWRGVSQGLLARRDPAHAEPVPTLFHIPRYRLGRAVKALLDSTLRRHRLPASARFNSELRLWDLAGFLYGRFFVRIDRFYQPVTPP